MTSYSLAAAAALALLTPSPAAAGDAPAQEGNEQVVARAVAEVSGKGITGTATLTEVRRGDSSVVTIHLKASGLTPGLHGVHLHETGKCEPDFSAAAGHFDPGPAGNTDPDTNHPFHMGDMPNLQVGEDGTGELRAETTRITLTDSLVSVFDQDGTAIIVHANPDQGITGTARSGVSGGPRVACGVVRRARR